MSRELPQIRVILPYTVPQLQDAGTSLYKGTLQCGRGVDVGGRSWRPSNTPCIRSHGYRLDEQPGDHSGGSQFRGRVLYVGATRPGITTPPQEVSNVAARRCWV